jgi:hypothetical protein
MCANQALRQCPYSANCGKECEEQTARNTNTVGLASLRPRNEDAHEIRSDDQMMI